MKHRNLTMLMLVTLTALVLVGCSLAYADHFVPAGSPSTEPARNSAEEALAVALAHAGVSSGEISAKHVELDWEDTFWEYEIEFCVGSTEYDYHIHGETGRILSWEKDMDD